MSEPDIRQPDLSEIFFHRLPSLAPIRSFVVVTSPYRDGGFAGEAVIHAGAGLTPETVLDAIHDHHAYRECGDTPGRHDRAVWEGDSLVGVSLNVFNHPGYLGGKNVLLSIQGDYQDIRVVKVEPTTRPVTT